MMPASVRLTPLCDIVVGLLLTQVDHNDYGRATGRTGERQIPVFSYRLHEIITR